MFLRFVTTEVVENTRVRAGIFTAAYDLKYSDTLPHYAFDHLCDLLRWFDLNLDSPYHYQMTRPNRRHRSVCWFRCSAAKHIKKAHEMAAFLQNYDVHVELIKTKKTGYILYQDKVQVFAQPFADSIL